MSYVSEACRAPEALARDEPGRAQGAAASKLGGGALTRLPGAVAESEMVTPGQLEVKRFWK